MRKIISIAMCGLAVLTVGAQKANVDQAKKLAGKTEKIDEARSLIKEAMANPETSEDALTYYTAGKIEWDAYEKNLAKQMVNPDAVNPVDMSDELLNGYGYFLQVFPLDKLPNAKGEIKPKYTKELQKKIAGRHGDFWNAAINYHNADMKYPQAYNAFMIFGDLPELAVLENHAPQVPDSTRALAYFYAGTEAYEVNANDESAKAFRKARDLDYNDSRVYLFEIASWEKIENSDSTRYNEARDSIFSISKAGYDKYGLEQPLFLNSMVTALIDDEKPDEAITLLSEASQKYPDAAFIFGLMGYANDRAGNDEASEANYRKAVKMDGVDYETLRLAARKFLRMGRNKWDEIEIGDPDIVAKKNEVRTKYFESAKETALQARALTENTAEIDAVIDDIDYLLSLK